VHELLPDGWAELRRSAWIHSHDTLTPYPFQANLAGLPLEVRMECLLGFVEALREHERARRAGDPAAAELPVPKAVAIDARLPFLAVAPPPLPGEPSFRDWILATFGRGFAEHFFEPYNEKLWRRPLAEVTGDWVSWSIPRPTLADVLRGALTRQEKSFGYNPEFLYPRDGGIDRLPRAMAARLRPGVLQTGLALEQLDAGRRRARCSDGSVREAPLILSSLPLPALAALTTDLPRDLREAAAELTHVSIRAVNFGVRGPAPRAEVQWVYFPGREVPFHRLGLPCALTPAMAPAGHHSLVAEIAFRPDEAVPPAQSVEATLAALVATGWLRDAADVVETRVLDIAEAYVVFDGARRRVLPALFRFYLERGIVPLGRYGAWDYLAMEDSLRHGREAAQFVRESLP